MQHNDSMIRGMGLYSAEGVVDLMDVRSWEMPGDGHVQPKLLELKEQCTASPGAFVWVGLFEPTKSELEIMAEVFELPHLQVEDAGNDAERPKIEAGPGSRSFVLV